MTHLITERGAPALRAGFHGAWPEWLATACRLGLGVIFIWSGMVKLIDPQTFGLTIAAFGLLPVQWISAAAVTLSLIEVAAGAGLLIDLPGCLETIAALLLVFLAVLGYGLGLGLDIDCGCFGADDPEGTAYRSLRPALYRDLVMLGAAGFLFYRRHGRQLNPVNRTHPVRWRQGGRGQ